ncbi:hypothetical protein WDZ92_28265, partial [Nostoc sp. NIES-2111]
AARHSLTLKYIADCSRVKQRYLNNKSHFLSPGEVERINNFVREYEAAVKAQLHNERDLEQPADHAPQRASSATQASSEEDWPDSEVSRERPEALDTLERTPKPIPSAPTEGGESSLWRDVGFDRAACGRRIRIQTGETGRNNFVISNLLLSAKTNLKHGEFQDFIATETQLSQSFAGKAVKVARMLEGRNIVDSTILPWEALTLLATAKALDGRKRGEFLSLLLGDGCPRLKEFRQLLAEAKRQAASQTILAQDAAAAQHQTQSEFDELLGRFMNDKVVEVARALGFSAAARRFKEKLEELAMSAA